MVMVAEILRAQKEGFYATPHRQNDCVLRGMSKYAATAYFRRSRRWREGRLRRSRHGGNQGVAREMKKWTPERLQKSAIPNRKILKINHLIDTLAKLELDTFVDFMQMDAICLKFQPDQRDSMICRRHAYAPDWAGILRVGACASDGNYRKAIVIDSLCKSGR